VRGQIIGATGAIILVYNGTDSRWRIVGYDPGQGIPITFSASDWRAGAGTLTIASGDVIGNTYKQFGTELHLFQSVSNADLSAAAGVFYFLLPNSFTATTRGVQVGVFGRILGAGTWQTCAWGYNSSTSTTEIFLFELNSTAYGPGVNILFWQGSAIMNID